MGLETTASLSVSLAASLHTDWPLASDPISDVGAHVRNLKWVIYNTFPLVAGEVSCSRNDLFQMYKAVDTHGVSTIPWNLMADITVTAAHSLSWKAFKVPHNKWPHLEGLVGYSSPVLSGGYIWRAIHERQVRGYGGDTGDTLISFSDDNTSGYTASPGYYVTIWNNKTTTSFSFTVAATITAYVKDGKRHVRPGGMLKATRLGPNAWLFTGDLT